MSIALLVLKNAWRICDKQAIHRKEVLLYIYIYFQQGGEILKSFIYIFMDTVEVNLHRICNIYETSKISCAEILMKQ